MKFFSRVSDIISANVSDLLDRAEDPEKMVKLLIVEMEEYIEKAREGLAKAIAGEKQLEASLKKNRDAAAEWQSKAEAAIERSDDDLARRCLERKKEFEKIADSMQPQWEAARRASDALKSDFRRLEETSGGGSAKAGRSDRAEACRGGPEASCDDCAGDVQGPAELREIRPHGTQGGADGGGGGGAGRTI